MKQLINEAKRFQQLANIKEAPDQRANNIAMKYSNTAPNTSGAPGATAGITVNTADENRIQDTLENSPLFKSRLKDISNATELDGLFKVILSYTSIENLSKSNFITALNRALKELEPTSSTITTKKSK